jgi:hypothetical protein
MSAKKQKLNVSMSVQDKRALLVEQPANIFAEELIAKKSTTNKQYFAAFEKSKEIFLNQEPMAAYH